MKKNMSIAIFEEIFEFTKIHQKKKLGGAICKMPPFGTQCTNLTHFFKLCNYKVGKVKKICTMIAIKKCAIANGVSCGFLRPPIAELEENCLLLFPYLQI